MERTVTAGDSTEFLKYIFRILRIGSIRASVSVSC